MQKQNPQNDTGKAKKKKLVLTKQKKQKVNLKAPAKVKSVKKTTCVEIPVNATTPVKNVKNVKNVRKINLSPTLADTAGINISVAKVKNIISSISLNKNIFSAANEIKNSSPQNSPNIKDSPNIKISKLSSETQDCVNHAYSVCNKLQKTLFSKDVINKMDTSTRGNYHHMKRVAKDLHDDYEKTKSVLDRCEFDVCKFNVGFDPLFYSNYTEVSNSNFVPKNEGDNEWKDAIDKINKLKIRFSSTSRVLLSSFVELLINQVAHNSIFNCVSEGKKILQISHAINTQLPGFKERFPLYSLIENLSVYKNAVKSVENDVKLKHIKLSKKNTLSTETTDLSIEADSQSDNSNDDLCVDKKYQFKYYISEICRSVRMRLINENKDSNETDTLNNTYTSISKTFKKFCSSLIFEFLVKLGDMLTVEVDARCIKTVNNSIVYTVIQQYHIAVNVPFDESLKFMKSSSAKYSEFVKLRQSSKVKSQKSVPVSGVPVSGVPVSKIV
jgi:hypothetical protein